MLWFVSLEHLLEEVVIGRHENLAVPLSWAKVAFVKRQSNHAVELFKDFVPAEDVEVGLGAFQCFIRHLRQHSLSLKVVVSDLALMIGGRLPTTLPLMR